MKALKPTGNADCDDILHWLDTRSVSVHQGMPVDALHARWTQTGRTPGALNHALKQLIGDNWIAPTPHVESEHLRFTVEGFRRLMECPAAGAIAANDEDSGPIPRRRSGDHAADTASSTPPTESSLRNAILSVYRGLNMRAEDRLIGMTLSRYWQESGYRAADLRGGIDVLLRDGYIEQRLVGIDRHWMLTHEGAFFTHAPPTPLRLSLLAPPLDMVDAAPPPAELRSNLAQLLVSLGLKADDALDYEPLRTEWVARTHLDENALLHALDLLYKGGQISIGSEATSPMLLTAKGVDLGSRRDIVRLFTRLSRSLR